MIKVRGYAARDAQSPLVFFSFERRDPRPAKGSETSEG